jgi:prolyl-tRNA synthetase
VHSLSCECYLPIGKAIQGCTSHYLGTNFAKAFNITYAAEDQSTQLAHQNSWGFTTRSIGIAVMMHSDDKGLVLPPRVAENRIVILPIMSKGDNTEIIAYCESLAEMLREHDPIIDAREHTFGYRINEAELSGIPIRIDVGPKERAEGKVTIVRRDTGVKESVLVADLVKLIPQQLDAMHANLYAKAHATLTANIVEEYADLARITALVGEGKIVQTAYVPSEATDDKIREITGGKTLCMPFDKHVPKGAVCPFTKHAATHVVYLGKSL